MFDFEFSEPAYLILLWIVPLFIALSVYAHFRRTKLAAVLLSTGMQKMLMPENSLASRIVRNVLFNLAIITMILALAGPHHGRTTVKEYRPDMDVMVVLDVSKSMLAKDDGTSSRLFRAVSALTEVAENSRGARLGLILFAGSQSTACPLTYDRNFFKSIVKDVGPESTTRGGSLIGDAIRKAIGELDKDTRRRRAILLITDGDDQDSFPMEAAADAASKGISIYTAGVGGEEGHAIPIQTRDGNVSYLKYHGETVITKLDDDLLKRIADTTGGFYIPPGNVNRLSEYFNKGIAPFSPETGREVTTSKPNLVAMEFLLAAVILFVLYFIVPTYPKRDPAAIRMMTPANRVMSQTRVAANKTSANQSGAATKKPVAGVSAAGRQLTLLIISLTCVGSLAFPKPLRAESDSDEHTNTQTAGVVDLASTGTRAGQTDTSKVEPDKRGGKRGFKQLADAEYDRAADSFLAAATADPAKRDYYYLARAYALTMAKRYDDAVKSYRQVTGSANDVLAARARFNLGVLYSDMLKDKASDTPDKISNTDTRGKILELADNAQRFYRLCLDIMPDHGGAQNNLEIVRLWIKNLKRKWKEADRKNARDAMDLLRFVTYLVQQQRTLLDTTGVMEGYPDTPGRMSRAMLAARDQKQLAIDSEYLEDKLKRAMDRQADQNGQQAQAGQTPQAGDDTKSAAEQTRKMLEFLVKDIESGMYDASAYLKSGDFTNATASQAKTIEQLEKIWNMVAPFDASLSRAVSDQKQLIDTTDAFLKAAESPETQSRRSAHDSLMRDQRVIADIVRVLNLKAGDEKQRFQKMDPNAGKSENLPKPGSLRPSEKEYVEKMIEWLDDAAARTPQAEAELSNALEKLDNADYKSARDSQDAALDILQDILGKRPKPDIGILMLLQKMIDSQRQIIDDTQSARKMNSSDARTNLLNQTRTAQQSLADRALGLKAKLDLTKEQEQYRKSLETMIDSIHSAALNAAASLSRTDISPAVPAERDALDKIEFLWMVMASVPDTLQRSYSELQTLEPDVRAMSMSPSGKPDPDTLADALQRHQNVEQLVSVLDKKAIAAQKAIQQRAQQATQSAPASGQTPPPAAEKKYTDWLKQVEKQSPKAVSELSESNAALNDNRFRQSAAHLRKAEKILEDLLKKMPNKPKPQQQKQRQKSQNRNNGEKKNTGRKRQSDLKNLMEKVLRREREYKEKKAQYRPQDNDRDIRDW